MLHQVETKYFFDKKKIYVCRNSRSWTRGSLLEVSHRDWRNVFSARWVARESKFASQTRKFLSDCRHTFVIIISTIFIQIGAGGGGIKRGAPILANVYGHKERHRPHLYELINGVFNNSHYNPWNSDKVRFRHFYCSFISKVPRRFGRETLGLTGEKTILRLFYSFAGGRNLERSSFCRSKRNVIECTQINPRSSCIRKNLTRFVALDGCEIRLKV